MAAGVAHTHPGPRAFGSHTTASISKSIPASAALLCTVHGLFAAYVCTCMHVRCAVCVGHTDTIGRSALDALSLTSHCTPKLSLTSPCTCGSAKTCHVLHRVRGITTPMSVCMIVGPLGACPRVCQTRPRGGTCHFTGRSSASVKHATAFERERLPNGAVRFPPKALRGL